MSMSLEREGEDGAQNGVMALYPVRPDDTPQYHPDEPKPPGAMTAGELREAEPDVVEYLFRSVEASARDVAVITLPRFEVPQKDADGNWQRDEHGRVILGPLKLRVHALYQRDFDDIQRKTRRVRRRDERGRMVEQPDQAEQALRMIDAALVDEDRLLLNDRRMRDRFGAGDVAGVLARMLYAGEAVKAADLVRRLSGIPLELTDDQVDLVGNSSNAEADS